MVRLAIALCLAASAVMADAGGRIALDLNRLDPVDAGCRLTFVVQNDLTDLEGLVVETVIFDPAGRVAAFSLFDFGALPLGAMRARQFDLAGQGCDDVAQVLANGVASCTGDGVDAPVCARALDLTATADGVEVAE
jgi:hypothetical protein